LWPRKPSQASFLERLDDSALLLSDIETPDRSKPVRPTRWHDYIFEDDFEAGRCGTLLKKVGELLARRP